MAKAQDSAQAEEPVIDESDSVVQEPTVELDQEPDVSGEIVLNPVVEEVEEDASEAEEETNEEEPEETPEVEPTEELPDSPKEPEVASDPGDFQPKGDYGFEITTLDGKTIKINTVEQAEAFADRMDTEENLVAPSQFTKFTRQFSKMDAGIDREKSQFEADKQVFETQQAQEQARTDQTLKWSNELNYLESKGILPKVPPEINNAPNGWNDNPDEPGVKARMDIFRWMDKENTDRRAAGIPEVTSAVDAQRMMATETDQTAEKAEAKKETSERRTRGKMVTSTSSFTPDNEQSGTIIGEGGSLRDLIFEAQNQ